MNIFISNCSNTFNYGSMMMGENFIKTFDEISMSENDYYVETEDFINIERLIEATGITRIHQAPMNSLFSKVMNKYDHIFAYINFKKFVTTDIQKYDAIVVLGGDDYTEDYGWKGPILNAIKLNLLKKHKVKIVMLGQTMGPYKSFRKKIMSNLLGSIDKIYPRDPITYKHLKKINLRNISLTDDLALLSLNKQEYQTRSKEYITYCPSELIYKYALKGTRSDWVDFNLFMIETIMKKYPGKKLVLLAHVIQPEHVDDRKMVNELYNMCEEKFKERIIIENKEMYPFEVRNYIQKSFFTISSRMHPVISSIQCEIPAIALSYSSKYWGIIGEKYGMKEYIMDVRYTNYEEMKREFVGKIEKIEKNYEEIQGAMKVNNKAAVEEIKKSLIEIDTIFAQV